MIKKLHRWAALSCLLLTLACASKSATKASGSERGLLTTEEMIKAGYPDAFTTVQTLRPTWLQRRGINSFGRGRDEVKVYLDGSLLGGADALRQITVRSITSIRYLDGIQASERYGFDHGGGAIVVSTR